VNRAIESVTHKNVKYKTIVIGRVAVKCVADGVS
jgi:hypothetical protein